MSINGLSYTGTNSTDVHDYQTVEPISSWGDQLSPGEWISYALFELVVSFIIAKCKKYVERERERISRKDIQKYAKLIF